MVNKLLEVLTKKNSKKLERKEKRKKKIRVEKVIKRKVDKLYVKWKGYNNSFNRWINQKSSRKKMSQYFPKPVRSFGENINVKVDLSNYATKTDL